MNLHAKILCSVLALTCATVDGAVAKTRPEYKSKLSGYEFGMGVPLVTPLTGYNFFVGYVNKDANSFWGRRFGIRADFTIPSTLKFKGTLSDSDELSDDGKKQYEINGTATVLGFKLKSSDFTDEKLTIDAFEDDSNYTPGDPDAYSPVLIGQNAADVSLNIKHQNMGLLVDFYPFGNTWFLGGIRFSGGYYLGDLDISAMATFNNNIDYSYKVDINKVAGGGYDVLHAQIVQGSRIGADFHWKYHGPYAGLGFDLGIWRGFKFYMDAGVVFAKAPKVSNKNVKDDKLHLRARYEIYDSTGASYSSGSEMVDILSNGIATEPDVDQIVRDTVGMVVRDTLDHYSSDTHYSGVIDDFVSGMNNNTDLCPNGNCFTWNDLKSNFSQIGQDIVDYLYDETSTGANTKTWISTLVSSAGDDLAETITEIKSKWQESVADATSGIQNDVHDAWQDYSDKKQETIDDINDFLKDYGMVPTIKIGFMYRF